MHFRTALGSSGVMRKHRPKRKAKGHEPAGRAKVRVQALPGVPAIRAPDLMQPIAQVRAERQLVSPTLKLQILATQPSTATQHRTMKTRHILILTLALASHAAQAAQEKLAATIAETRAEVARTHAQLQQTVSALTALTEQKKGDLRESYNTFVESVKGTQAAAAATAGRAQSMQSASKEYFDAWQSDLAGISNTSLRKKSQKRLETVRKSYDEVVVALRAASERFKPLLANLEDVQKALANDVTPGGVKAVRGTARDAESNMRKVQSDISKAIKELQSMEKALSSETTGKS
jgi:hypothetical protein